MKAAARIAVLGVIVLLCSGLLSAFIAKLRHHADCVYCTSNLRLFAMDLRNYHDFYHHFPRGTVPNSQLPPERRLSWYVGEWAFVGEGQTRLLVDKTKAWDEGENYLPMVEITINDEPNLRYRTELVGHVSAWHCPVNPNRAGSGEPCFTHYVGVAGVGKDVAELDQVYPFTGVFGYDRQTSLEQIKDGASLTLLVIETATANGPWTRGGPWTVRGVDPGGLPYLGTTGQFSSLHVPHVTHAVFADGSVHALKESMSPQVFEALATISGREEIDEEF